MVIRLVDCRFWIHVEVEHADEVLQGGFMQSRADCCGCEDRSAGFQYDQRVRRIWQADTSAGTRDLLLLKTRRIRD